MDQESLVDAQVSDGQSLIERLIQDNFDVTAAFWVKPNEEALWRLFIASPEVTEATFSVAYAKAYYALESLSLATITNLNISLLSDDDPIAKSAIELRDRSSINKPLRFSGKTLGPLSAKEVYIYPKIEIPIRQSYMVHYVRQGNTNEWRATTRKREYYRGQKATGAVSYSTALWEGDKPKDQKFAIVYVMVDVGEGIDESAIIANPLIMGNMAEQAQVLADEMFKSKNPDAVITHEPLALTVN